MTKAAALHSFFESFGIAAYSNTSVPQEATYPYLTYTPIFDEFGYPVSLTVNLWYQTTSEKLLNDKAEEIGNYIDGGRYVKYDGGAILFTKGSPFSQSILNETDESIKRRYMNITAEYLSK